MNKSIRSMAALLLTALLCLTALSCGGSANTQTTTTETGSGTAVETGTGTYKSPPVTLAFDQPAATSNPLADPSGPFYHSVLKASSADGLSFTVAPGTLLEHASVPDMIRMPDGRLFIFAVDGANRSRSGLMVAMSDDNGATWQQGSLQTKSPNLGVDPEAVLLPDGMIRLYYVVFPKDKPPLGENGLPVLNGQTIQIKSALSRDGVTFEEEAGVRYEASEIITDPDVVKIGGKWFMYLSEGPRNVAVSSADGMAFTLEKTIRNNGSVSNTVPIGADKFRQFYCDRGIKSAVSNDGLIWQDDAGTRIPASPDKIQCDPAPIQLAAGWLMVFKEGPMPTLN
jgi:hypothetical protein